MSNRAEKQLIKGLLTGQTQGSVQYRLEPITPVRKPRETTTGVASESMPIHRHRGETRFSSCFAAYVGHQSVCSCNCIQIANKHEKVQANRKLVGSNGRWRFLKLIGHSLSTPM